MAVNWHRAQALLEEALTEAPEQRDAWLLAQCGDDFELYRCVTAMVARRESGDPPSDALVPFAQFPSKPSDSSALPPLRDLSQDLPPGSVIGDYKIDALVGEGGMGVVYRAHRVSSAETVAIKLIRPGAATPDRVERFTREQKVLRKFTHPNIARMLDANLTAPLPYLVMEYVDGLPIAVHCRDRHLDLAARLDLVIKVCHVVGAAHAADIVHRDLKPANILVTDAGEVKLLDFGIAKYVDSTMPATTGRPLMTPEYASPEQLRNQPVTPASDVYSLGVILYELLTGARPHENEPTARVSRHLTVRDPRIRTGDLDAVVAKALCRRLGDGRYATTGALADDLLACLECRRPAARWWFRSARTRSFAATAFALVVIVVTIAVGYAAWAWATREPFVFRHRQDLGRPRIAVLDQGASRSELRWTATSIAQLLNADFSAGGHVQLIGDNDVQRLRRELTLPDSAPLPVDIVPRFQALLGADLLLLVRVDPADEAPRLRVKIVLQGAESGAPLLIEEKGEANGLALIAEAAGVRVRQALLLDSRLASEMAEIRALMPDDPEVLRLYAGALQHLRDFAALEARTLLEEAVKRAPDEPLLHAALSDAWLRLGHVQKAAASGCRARDLATDVPRELRMRLEAQCAAHGRDWKRAVEVYRALRHEYPLSLEYGLLLAQVQSTHDVQGAIATIAELRLLPSPLNDDVRIDLAEATLLPEAADKEKAARRAAAKAASRGLTYMHAQALRMLCGALASSEDAAKAEEAVRTCQDSVAIARVSRDANAIVSALNNLGMAYKLAGDPTKALESHDEVSRIGPGENQDLLARNLANAGIIESDLGRLDSAEQRYQHAATAFRRLDNEPFASTVDSWRALLLQQIGRLARAEQLMTPLCDAPPPRDEPQVLSCQGNRGGVYFDQGRTKEAAAAWRTVIDHFIKRGDESSRYFIASLGILDVSRARFTGVLERLRAVVKRSNPTDDAALLAHQALGNLFLVLGDLDEADREYRRVVESGRRAPKPLAVVDGTFGLAVVALARGDHPEAVRQAREAADHGCEIRFVSTCVLSLLAEGEAWLAIGDTAQARARFNDATKQAAGAEHHDVRTALARFAARLQAAGGDVDGARAALRVIAGEEWRAERVAAALETELLHAEIGWRHRAANADELRLVEQRARLYGVMLVARRADRVLTSPTRPVRATAMSQYSHRSLSTF